MIANDDGDERAVYYVRYTTRVRSCVPLNGVLQSGHAKHKSTHYDSSLVCLEFRRNRFFCLSLARLLFVRSRCIFFLARYQNNGNNKHFRSRKKSFLTSPSFEWHSIIIKTTETERKQKYAAHFFLVFFFFKRLFNRSLSSSFLAKVSSRKNTII